MSGGCCDVCNCIESMLWHPFAYGISRGPNPCGQYQYITMCDDCYVEFIRWCKEHKSRDEMEKDGI